MKPLSEIWSLLSGECTGPGVSKPTPAPTPGRSNSLRRFLGARALAEEDVELEPEQRPRQRPGPSVPSKIWKKSTDRFTTTSTLTPSSARTRVILTAKDAEAWDTDEFNRRRRRRRQGAAFQLAPVSFRSGPAYF